MQQLQLPRVYCLLAFGSWALYSGCACTKHMSSSDVWINNWQNMYTGNCWLYTAGYSRGEGGRAGRVLEHTVEIGGGMPRSLLVCGTTWGALRAYGVEQARVWVAAHEIQGCEVAEMLQRDESGLCETTGRVEGQRLQRRERLERFRDALYLQTLRHITLHAVAPNRSCGKLFVYCPDSVSR